MNSFLLNNKYQLSWNEYGATDGEPVFYFHGTPGSSLEPQMADTIVRDLEIRLIAPNRPGFGGSDAQEGFRLLDWADAVTQLADKLQLDDFSIIGFSGGGPYALACAHELGKRIKYVTLVSSPAPFESKAMQEYINADFKPLYELALVDYPATLQQISQFAKTPETLTLALQSTLAPCDKTIFEHEGLFQYYLGVLTLALQHGAAGYANGLS